MTSPSGVPWPPAPSLTDERLAFLAVEPLLRRRSRTKLSLLVRLFEGTRSSLVFDETNDLPPRGAHHELQSERMLDYVVAADLAAQQLNADERKALRASGALPDWFLPRVEEHFKAHRKNR
jgi:hypothetical protein